MFINSFVHLLLSLNDAVNECGHIASKVTITAELTRMDVEGSGQTLI
jgi:hypothetical protein